MPGALDGVRVLDFGQYIAGPLAAMLLADQGAEVIRIDPPGGPRMDVPANATWNRGKRSIVLDLRDPVDLAAALRLAATSDVLIENFRPTVMDRLGLGASVLLHANSGLIYLSMPGFAADHPRAGEPAWEGVVSAAASLYTRPTDPVFTAIPISSSYAAFHGAGAVAMALFSRERDGLGQHIEAALYDSTFTAIGYRAQRRHDSAPMSEVAAAAMQMPWFGPHRTLDDRYVFFHIANKNAKDLIDAAGAGQWWDAPDAATRIQDLFATRTAQQWEDLGASVGTEMAVCTTSAQWLAHPHATGSHMVVPIEDPSLGAMTQPGLAVNLSASPGSIKGARRALDADRVEVLADARGMTDLPVATSALGSVPAEPAQSESVHGPLAALRGIKVLDLCIVLAGPTCARTLGEYGADVIKIDGPPRPSLTGGGDSQIAAAFNIEVNRGKRSIVLDLATAQGQDVFWTLVDEADVVVENYRNGVVDRLGIGYEDVRKRKPDIIYASLNAYGSAGPWADRPGHEQLGQSVTGMSVRFGGDGPPVLQSVALNDFGTGLLGAYGIGLALMHRARTGEGQRVTGSLAQTACMLQSLYLQDYDGKAWEEPRGQQARGFGPLQRLYQAADGWFFLGCDLSERERLSRIPGLDGAADSMQDADLSEALERGFAAERFEHWAPLLREAGIGVSRLASVREIMDDPWATGRGLSITRDHMGIGPVQTSGQAPRLSRTPLRPGRPAPSTGADTADILAELGRGDQVDNVLAQASARPR